MSDEKLNQQYRDEGWGILAEAAGFNPVNTESAAREAFRFCWDILTEDQRAKLNPRKGGVAIPEPH